MSTNDAQRTLGWFKARLGKFTGSEVGKLMQRGRSGEAFGGTAMSYIMKKAKERLNDQRMIDDEMLFEEYVQRHSVTNKAMQWGTDNEPFAREAYEKRTGCRVVEVGSIVSKELPMFASSPDGFVYDEEKEESGVIEIKCPIEDASIINLLRVRDADGLKKANTDYYWQCHAHMMVTGAAWCDFVVYCPELREGMKLHVARIDRDEAAMEEIRRRVTEANEIADSIINDIKGNN